MSSERGLVFGGIIEGGGVGSICYFSYRLFDVSSLQYQLSNISAFGVVLEEGLSVHGYGVFSFGGRG